MTMNDDDDDLSSRVEAAFARSQGVSGKPKERRSCASLMAGKFLGPSTPWAPSVLERSGVEMSPSV
jgi:hypothetical protein